MKNLNRQEYLGVPGIYMLQGNVTDKIYIGSARCLYKRINSHLKDLLANRHCNSNLQNYVNKYGIESIEVIILKTYDESISREELYKIEQKFLDDKFDNGKNCFNAHKDVFYLRNNPEINIKKVISIRKSWKENYEELYEIVNKNLDKARESKKQLLKQGKYFPSNMKNKKHKESSKLKMSISAKKRGRHDSSCKKVYQYDLNGKFIRSFDAARDAARFLGIDPTGGTNISKCASGGRNRAYGYLWKYFKKEQLKLNYLLEDTELEIKKYFTYLSDIALYINCDDSTISRSISENRLIFNKYKVYKNE